jgi:outer membrane receptor protein involved in Fe transport
VTPSVLLLFLLCIPVTAQQIPGGHVRDSARVAVPNATVEIRSLAGVLLSTQLTGPDGSFQWPPSPPTQVRVNVTHSGFAMGEHLLTAGEEVVIELEPESIYTRLTVNATRGGAEEAASSPHLAFVVDQSDIAKRPIATLGNALEQQPGILVQQSTYAQVSPFLRGLTGYQVLNLVDGIRFNNSTFRSGPNQYLAYIEPMQAQRVEGMLGPTGSQYGSDSLGGTIQVLTSDPRFGEPHQWQAHGDFLLGGASADMSTHGGARLSVANDKLFLLGGVSGRRHNDLRAGGGDDSRNVFHRLFGMSLDGVENLLGSRQQDSGFRQYGAQAKLAWRPSPDHLFTLYYQRGQQDGVRGYKDLLGGLGRLMSTFTPQELNWFYARYEKTRLGFLDTLSGTFSLNSQTDGGSRQNLRFTDSITRDYSKVNSYGYSAQATTHWRSRLLASFGGDIYDERISSERDVLNPVTQAVTRPRPLYPDQSTYQNLGLFAQSSFDLTGSLRASGGVRLTGVRFHTTPSATYGIPESSQWFRDVTFHSSLRWQITSAFGLHGIVSRGFRAPNLNDLGALGLNDLGYEIPSSDAIAGGALLSTDSGESATSKGARLGTLAAESLMNYEFGARITTRRLYARVQLFDAELTDPIVRRTLLFPASAAPTQLAGLPVTVLAQTAAQKAQDVVAVATAMDPRAVKSFVNDGHSRYYGIESLAVYTLTRGWTVEANYTYLLGRDLNPNRNIRRLPPQMGSTALRYMPVGRRPWWEVNLAMAGKQSRLSGGDRDDERIGASFRRRDIQDFFQGSRVAPYLNNGVFTPTNETLLQIQNRVLPIGAVVNGVTIVDDNSRAPLYLSTAGWATLNVRAGFPLSERWQLRAALENLLDRNYRFHGSGVDAPGLNAYLSIGFRF